MKKICFIASVLFAILSTGCNNSGNSGTTSDSLKIARIIAEKYPDSLSLKSGRIVFGNRPRYDKSAAISDTDAIQQHIAYLLDTPLTDNENRVIYSLFLEKKDLESLNNLTKTGARLLFCNDTLNGISYTGIIMVALDDNYHNILKKNGKTVIVNRLEPCPDKCPETYQGDIKHDPNDLNMDAYDNFRHKGFWYNAQAKQWVDIYDQPGNKQSNVDKH
jgi:hypothetical protein